MGDGPPCGAIPLVLKCNVLAFMLANISLNELVHHDDKHVFQHDCLTLETQPFIGPFKFLPADQPITPPSKGGGGTG